MTQYSASLYSGYCVTRVMNTKISRYHCDTVRFVLVKGRCCSTHSPVHKPTVCLQKSQRTLNIQHTIRPNLPSALRSMIKPRTHILKPSTHQQNFACSYGTGQDEDNNNTDIHFEEFSKLVSAGDIILIDVRQPEELEYRGRIENSINIPLGELYDALEMPPDKFKSLYGIDLPDYEDNRIVFSCAAGIRSAVAVQIARELGFDRSRHYVGGFEEWSNMVS